MATLIKMNKIVESGVNGAKYVFSSHFTCLASGKIDLLINKFRHLNMKDILGSGIQE